MEQNHEEAQWARTGLRQRAQRPGVVTARFSNRGPSPHLSKLAPRTGTGKEAQVTLWRPCPYNQTRTTPKITPQTSSACDFGQETPNGNVSPPPLAVPNTTGREGFGPALAVVPQAGWSARRHQSSGRLCMGWPPAQKKCGVQSSGHPTRDKQHTAQRSEGNGSKGPQCGVQVWAHRELAHSVLPAFWK